MIGIDRTPDVPVTVRYHQDTIEQIVQGVEERVYCALLGPRLCGKTLILHYIEQNISPLLGWTCFLIDMEEVRSTTQRAFFEDLIHLTAKRLLSVTGLNVHVPETRQANSSVFRAFLFDCLSALKRDLVLIFDPLEALPIDLVQALLTSLRAAYMDQRDQEYQLTAIVSGALSLANLTVGESSPFRGIARRVFVADLSPEESLELILEYLADNGVRATRPATQQLLQATSGDIYLIRKLTQCCVDLVKTRTEKIIRARDIAYITNRFLKAEVFRYAPLVEAIRLIEENPDLLQCILMLLGQNRVQRSTLPLPLSPDLDPLYLTGVIERDAQDFYQLQNGIYRSFLEQYFSADRVGQILAITGNWDLAMDFLHDSIRQGNLQARVEFLPATINSMYAADDLAQAVHYLRRGLIAAFGVHDSQIWFRPMNENYLRLIGPTGLREPGSWNEVQIELNADRLEARAYSQKVTLRGHEGERKVIRAIPLLIPGQRPIGVAVIIDDIQSDSYLDSRERDQKLVGFLNQAARALKAVHVRRQELTLAGKVQASLLPEVTPEIAGWQISAYWKPARETSGDFYDFIPLQGARLGIVIADVVDKGLGAALLMTLTRTLIRTFAETFPEQPEQLLKMTNQRILSDMNIGLFVTLFYGVLDTSSGLLTYANAGQTPPCLVMDHNRPQVILLTKTGMALGVTEEVSWYSETIQVTPGSVLFLYTDGIIDAHNSRGEFFGENQLIQTLSSHGQWTAGEIQETVISRIFNFAGAEMQNDDITLMILKRDAQ
jgi:hypothetical protein